jgi:hypothetical protein
LRIRGRERITHKRWLRSTSPGEMLTHLLDVGPGSAGDRPAWRRRFLLFHLACYRRAESLIKEDPVRPLVEALAAYVEGHLSREQFRLIQRGVAKELPCASLHSYPMHEDELLAAVERGSIPSPIGVLRYSAITVDDSLYFDVHYMGAAYGIRGNRFMDEFPAQCAIIRDIFGDPFRPITLSPEWCTDTATLLARQMHASHDFSTMPILADALQDAGCDSEDVLTHCRDANAIHVPGCWVVERILTQTNPELIGPPKTKQGAARKALEQYMAAKGLAPASLGRRTGE